VASFVASKHLKVATAAYDLLQSRLHDELDLLPWQLAIVHPEEVCPYPRGTAGYEFWSQAQALWLQLSKAAAS
jgi:hypothetical protein